ncbi:MAG: C39 family peptidase [Candidatus Heteroscillospira sp.]|jgi:hypothetical protein
MKRFIVWILTLLLLTGCAGALIQGIMAYKDEATVAERFGDTDYAAIGIEPETWRMLLEEAGRDDALVEILEHIEVYTEPLVKLAVTNKHARDYVRAWWQNTDTDGKLQPEDIKLSAQDGVQLFTQWDARWGYGLYGGSPMGITGCGPTCLSMVAVALTGNTQLNPLYIARMAEQSGYYVEGSGSSWDLMRAGSTSLGLSWREVPLSEWDMRSALDNGELIICSMLPGDFTTSGHFIVLDGWSDSGFSVKDPNSIERSERRWSYDELAGQTAVIWAYSAAG